MDNGQNSQEKQIIKSSKSKMAAVRYGPNFLLKYLIGGEKRFVSIPSHVDCF